MLEEDFSAMLEERPHSAEELPGTAELPSKTASLELNA